MPLVCSSSSSSSYPSSMSCAVVLHPHQRPGRFGLLTSLTVKTSWPSLRPHNTTPHLEPSVSRRHPRYCAPRSRHILTSISWYLLPTSSPRCNPPPTSGTTASTGNVLAEVPHHYNVITTPLSLSPRASSLWGPGEHPPVRPANPRNSTVASATTTRPPECFAKSTATARSSPRVAGYGTG